VADYAPPRRAGGTPEALTDDIDSLEGRWGYRSVLERLVEEVRRYSTTPDELRLRPTLS
jgi:hypothetical protein